MLSIESMVSRLIDICFHAPSQDASEAIEHAIDVLVESAGTLTNEVERKAEDDRVNGDFYRAIDAANLRRGY